MSAKAAMSRLRAAVPALAVSVAITLSVAFGQTDYRQDLDELRSQIEQLEADSAQMETRRNEIQRQLAQVEQDLAAAKEKRQNALQVLKNEDLSRQDSRRTKYSQLLEYDQLTEAFELTLLAYYQKSKLDNMTVALRDSDINRLQRSRAYLRYLTKAQSARIEQLHRSLNDDSDDSTVSHLVHQSSQLKQQIGQLGSAAGELKSQIAALDSSLIENRSELLDLQHTESRTKHLAETGHSLQSARSAKQAPDPEFRLTSPVEAPVKRKFGDPKQAYGANWSGVLYSVKTDQEVKSAAAGVVIFAKQHKKFGFLIIIDHGNELISLYAHNSELHVALGESVAARQVIATAGDSGEVDSPSLYFELRENGDPIDPLERLEG